MVGAHTMNDYLAGALTGIGLLGMFYLGLIAMSAFVKFMAKRARKKLLHACGGNELLMRTLLNAANRSAEERQLWRQIAALGPYTISFTRPGENLPLSKEVLYGAIVMKGLEHMIGATDLDAAVIDGMIQTTLEMAVERASSSKGDEE
jgi:hypothetical protein